MFGGVLTVDGLDAGAQSFLGRERFGAQPRLLGGFLGLPAPGRDGFARRADCLVELGGGRRFDARERAPIVLCVRELALGDRRVGLVNETRHRLERGALPATLGFFFGPPRRFGFFNLLDEGARALAHGLLLRPRFHRLQEREIGRGRRREHPLERVERDVLVVAVDGDLEQLASVGQARERGHGRVLVLGVACDAAQRPLIGRSRQGVRADRRQRLALGQRRQPARILHAAHRREGRGFVNPGVPGQRHQPIVGALARLGVGVGRGDAGEYVRVAQPRDGGSANLRFGVGFRQKRELHRVVEVTQGLESDGGVGVLPTRLRLELVQNSHGECGRYIRKGRAVLFRRLGDAGGSRQDLWLQSISDEIVRGDKTEAGAPIRTTEFGNPKTLCRPLSGSLAPEARVTEPEPRRIRNLTLPTRVTRADRRAH